MPAYIDMQAGESMSHKTVLQLSNSCIHRHNMRALGNSYIPEVLLEISYVLLISPETCPADPNISTRDTFVKKRLTQISSLLFPGRKSWVKLSKWWDAFSLEQVAILFSFQLHRAIERNIWCKVSSSMHIPIQARGYSILTATIQLLVSLSSLITLLQYL